jgi:hypothetical protein
MVKRMVHIVTNDRELFFCCEGPRSRCYGRTAVLTLIVQTQWWWWWLVFSFFRVMEHRWNETATGKPKYSGKTCPSATLSTRTDSRCKPGISGDRLAINRLSHGSADAWELRRVKHQVSNNTKGCSSLSWPPELDDCEYVTARPDSLTSVERAPPPAPTTDRRAGSTQVVRVQCSQMWRDKSHSQSGIERRLCDRPARILSDVSRHSATPSSKCSQNVTGFQSTTRGRIKR